MIWNLYAIFFHWYFNCFYDSWDLICLQSTLYKVFLISQFSTFFLSGLCCSWKFHHKMEQLFNKKEGATVEHGNQLGFQFYNTNLALQFAKLHFFFWDINFISSISTHDSDCSRGLQIWFYTHFCILQYLPFYYILNIIRTSLKTRGPHRIFQKGG